ncbi:MAG TPA: tetratricopeptide repeat protein, partial [Acidobacteriota bacterium]|nr:tetratricopeptide repeat protein [Acidobacteriota bacterium]
RVVAIISAHNEGDVIYHVIGDLIRQGVSVYLLDHQSTDDTVEIAAKWLGKGLLHIEKFPEDAHYAEENRFQYIWRDILKRKSELASQLEADWFIHADADEFRESPWPGLTLKEAIQVVDRLGYNAIDFELLNFRPVDNSFVPSEDVREYLKYYEGAENYNSRQVKAWKNLHVPIDLVTSGGHDVAFDGRTVFPIRFILRHYPIRSQQHGLLKVFHHRKNRFSAVERAMSWHVQYDQVRDESHDFIRRAEELRIYDPFEVRLKLLGSDPYGMLSKFQKQTEAGPDPEAQRPCPEQLEAMPPSGQRQRGAHDESEPVAASRGARTLAAEAHEGILKLLISAGKYSEAVFALERLAETYPDYAPAHNDLGVLYGESGDAPKALASYEKAVLLDAANPTFRKNLGDFLYVIMKRPADAVLHYEKALSLNPRDTETLLIMGNIRVESGYFHEAKDYYLRVLEMDPSNELAGKMFDALEDRERQTAAADPESLHREARSLVQRGRTDRAIEKLEIFLQAFPDHAVAHNDLGFLYFGKGDREKALAHYEKAVEADRSNLTALKNLADLYHAEFGRTEEALKLYTEVLSQEPDDVETLAALGSVCIALGRFEDAVPFYERILRLEPNNATAKEIRELIAEQKASALADDGTVTPDNVEHLTKRNFSGRTYKRIFSTDELMSIDAFPVTVDTTRHFSQIEASRTNRSCSEEYREIAVTEKVDSFLSERLKKLKAQPGDFAKRLDTTPLSNQTYDILIPIFNAFEQLQRCIDSVLRHTHGNHAIYLLDDCSTDSRVLPLLKSFEKADPRVRLIESSVNKGFVHNVNRGFELSENDVVILNSDTEVTEGWLDRMHRCLKSHSDIGIVCPLSNNA